MVWTALSTEKHRNAKVISISLLSFSFTSECQISKHTIPCKHAQGFTYPTFRSLPLLILACSALDCLQIWLHEKTVARELLRVPCYHMVHHPVWLLKPEVEEKFLSWEAEVDIRRSFMTVQMSYMIV